MTAGQDSDHAIWFDEDDAAGRAENDTRSPDEPLYFEYTKAPDEDPVAAGPAPRTKKSLSRRLGALLVWQLAGLIILWIVSNAPWNRLIGDAIAAGWTALALATLATAGVFMLAEIASARKIKRLGRIRDRAESVLQAAGSEARWQYLAAIKRHYRADSRMQSFVTAAESEIRSTSVTDTELSQWLAQASLDRYDREARRAVQRESVASGTLVALSFNFRLDMLMALWRSTSLVLRIADVYDVRGGLFCKSKLMASVLRNMVFAGATQYVSMNTSTHVAAAPARLLAQHLGQRELLEQGLQGVGIGLLTARLGLSAMQLCRPVPLPGPAYEQMIKSISAQLTTQIKKKKTDPGLDAHPPSPGS